MTDVTVVIPTRDRPALLALTVHSILAQREVGLDVVVVEDVGPRDARSGTARLLEHVGDARVRLVPNTGPSGVSGARNTGIAAAHANWIAFCDDDDLWAPDKLRSQLAAGDSSGATWVYAGDVTVDEGLRVRSGSPPPAPERLVALLRRYNAVPAGASNVLVRRDTLTAVGGFDPGLVTSEDWDLWLRLAANGHPACVSRPLVALRTHAAMASRDARQVLADVEVIAQRHGLPVDRARHHRWVAWQRLEDGRRAAALRHYVRAAAEGDALSLLRAARALVDPGVARRRARPTSDPWAREAQVWLDDLRAAAGTIAETGVERGPG